MNPCSGEVLVGDLSGTVQGAQSVVGLGTKHGANFVQVMEEG